MTTWPHSSWITAMRSQRHHLLNQVDGNFGFRDRVIDDHIVWFIEAARLRLKQGGNGWVGPHGLLWMPPGVAHSASIPHGANNSCLWFRFPSGAEPTHAPACRQSRWTGHVGAAFYQALYDDCCLQDEWSHNRARCIYFTLQPCPRRDVFKYIIGLSARQRTTIIHFDKKIGAAHHSIRPGFAGQYDPDYFTRQFRQTFGIPPRRWLVERRLHHAASLLEHGHRNITQLAHSLGYSDANFSLDSSHISLVYRRVNGRDNAPLKTR